MTQDYVAMIEELEAKGHPTVAVDLGRCATFPL
jgi:hypothetical protein